MSVWPEQEVKNSVLKIMQDHGLEIFPSRQFLEGINRVDLFNQIARHGGFIKCAEAWDIPRKERTPKWSLERIEKVLLDYVKEKGLDRMPSKPELIKEGRHDLGNALTRYKGMQYWSERIGLPLKQSETTKGNKYEKVIHNILEEKGHKVEQMSAKHVYDLLVNENVKVDVKCASPGYVRDSRAHTFRPTKDKPTCDLYVCCALDENDEMERIFVIPSKFAQLTTLCVGKESKYNAFINRWDYVDRYTEFYEKLVIE